MVARRDDPPAVEVGPGVQILVVIWLLWGVVFGATALVVHVGAPALVVFLCSYAGVALSTWTAGREASRLAWGRRSVLPCIALGIATVAALGRLPPDVLWGYLHGGVLLTAGAVVGATLGREVIDPRHVWPLVVVGAAADLWSVMAPAGLTHAVLEGEGPVALSTVTLHVPVPNVDGLGIAPVLGLGDVVFTAFLLGAAARLALPERRSGVGLAIGFGLCFVGLVVLEVPLPALPFVALSFAAAHGRTLAPRPRELGLAVALAAAVFAAGALLTRAPG